MKLNEIIYNNIGQYFTIKYANLADTENIIGSLPDGFKVGLDYQKDNTIILLYDDEEEEYIIGYLELKHIDLDSYKVLDARITRNYQGQELGYKLYKYIIQELNFTLISDVMQSQGAIKLWAKLWKTSGIHVYGMREYYSTQKHLGKKTKFFEVEPNDFNELEGKYDVYSRQFMDETDYRLEANFISYSEMIKNMINNKEITKKEGNKLIQKYKNNMEIQNNEKYDTAWNTYLVASNEK